MSPDRYYTWIPSPQITRHNGSEIDPSTLFFAAPPPEIGTVLSAQSGLRSDRSALLGATGIKVVASFTLFGVLVGGFLGAGFTNGRWFGILIGALVGAILIGLPINRRELHRADCTYVGTDGIARFRYQVRNGSRVRCELMRFGDAADLQTAFLGRNMGTNFNYQWRSESGKILFKIEGGHFSKKRSEDPQSVLHFAQAAEAAWSDFFMPILVAEIQRTGSCRFKTQRGILTQQYAIVGPGFLEIVTNGKPVRFRPADIDDVVLFQGLIMIRAKNAPQQTFNAADGSNGLAYLSYGCVANVKIFLMLLTQVVGIAWRSGE